MSERERGGEREKERERERERERLSKKRKNVQRSKRLVSHPRAHSTKRLRHNPERANGDSEREREE